MWPLWKSLGRALVSRRYRHYRSNYLVAAASELSTVGSTSSIQAPLLSGAVMLGHHLFVESPEGGPFVFDCLKLQGSTLTCWFEINQGVLAAIFEHIDGFAPTHLHGETLIYYKKCRDACPLDIKFNLIQYSTYIINLFCAQTGNPQSKDPLLLMSASNSLFSAVTCVRKFTQNAVKLGT